MAGINKVILVGNLGQDPEIKYMQDGTPVANFSVATSEEWNDRNTGEKRQKVEWHRIVIWRQLAEVCGQFLRKGKQVYLEGKLQTRSWEDNNGEKRYVTEIVCHVMQMLGHKGDSQGGQGGQGQQGGYQQGGGGYQKNRNQGQQGGYQQGPPQQQNRQSGPPAYQQQPMAGQPEQGGQIDDDDIPF